MKLGDFLRRPDVPQPPAQQILEQVVVTVPLAVIVEGHAGQAGVSQRPDKIRTPEAGLPFRRP
jgi:hypothetical protein